MAGTTSSGPYQEADTHSGAGPNDRFLRPQPAQVDPLQTVAHIPQSGPSTIKNCGVQGNDHPIRFDVEIGLHPFFG